MVEEAASFIERHKDQPFFVYFAINEPHYPYQGETRWLERYAALKYPRNLYAAFLRTMDERIGLLMSRLKALDLFDRTIVIFQSDHGHSTEETRATLAEGARAVAGPSSASSKGESACRPS